MEPLTRIAKYIVENPVKAIKYSLICAGLFATFNNLFDCIISDSPAYHYALFVGLVGVGTMMLVFIDSNIYLCFILALFGALSIFDNNPNANTIAGGVVLMLFSKRIADNMMFSILLYIVTVIMVSAASIFRGTNVSNALNMIIVYFAMYFVDYLLYNIKRM